jgi:hypothetical protein
VCTGAQAGVAVTDPNPLYHPDRLTMFDPNPPPTLDKSHIPSKVDRVLGNLLRALAGVCDGLCPVTYTRSSSNSSCLVVLRASSHVCGARFRELTDCPSLVEVTGGERRARETSRDGMF